MELREILTTTVAGRVARIAFAAVAATVVVLGAPAAPAQAQVGMTLEEFEKISGKSIEKYKGQNGQAGLIYRDVWVSEKNKKQFPGRTAIEMGPDNRVVKEVFFFDAPLPNTPDGAVDAVGIAFNLMPGDTPKKFIDSGRRPYEHGWVLWFDYGNGRYVNFFLNQEESQIEAVVGGIEATTI
jgi:hypothetical protein